MQKFIKFLFFIYYLIKLMLFGEKSFLKRDQENEEKQQEILDEGPIWF